jgi:predicted acetyltransferase
MNILLRPLCIKDEQSFKCAVNEFLTDKSGFEFAFNYDTSIHFSEYIRMVNDWSSGFNLPDKFVPNTFLVGLVNNKIIGRVSIRHILSEYLAVAGGHIGYGIVPSERYKSYGTMLLKLAIPVAFSLGIYRILITCDNDNFGSRKIIEKNGGIFENLIEDPYSKIIKRRYWIEHASEGSIAQ